LEICHALCFALAAAIGQEDEWDALVLEIAKGFGCAGYGRGGSQQDTVDAVDRIAY
jgi:hypothetical protein